MKFISIDPGEYGVMTLWNDIEPVKCIKYNERVVDNSEKKKDWKIISHRAEYKKAFEEYKGKDVILEFISTVFSGGGPFASFVLAKTVGDIKGLAFGLCEVIEKGNTPIEWKRKIDKDYLIKPPKVKWDKNEKKKRSIQLCEELFPNIDLRTGEKIEHKNGKIEEIKDDNQADSILIGVSYLISKGIVKVEKDANGKHKMVKI